MTVRVGVIGVGHLGYHHARIYNDLPDVSLTGIVDPDAARSAKVAGEFGAQVYGSPEALFAAGVDAVSIAAPTTQHFPLAMQALDAGMDVLVEKPMAATLTEAAALVAHAAKQKRLLQVGHVERFNGAVIALREGIAAPKFVECHRLSPYPKRSTDISVVHDLMIHDLDIVLALDGSEVKSLDAVGVPVFSETEDIANARIRFASGCVANLTVSRVSVERMRKIRIFEPNAYVSTDYSAQEVLVYRKKPGPMPPDADPMSLISIDALPVKKEEPLRLELESFIRCVKDRTRPEVAGEDGLRALELAERIVQFIREHS